MPREVDALELAPPTALRCAEAVARGDASAGWCVSIAITSALLVAYLPAASRDEMFGGGRGVAAGVWAPRGKARSSTAAWWCPDAGRSAAESPTPTCCSPAASSTSGRVPSVVALPKDDLQVLDTWHTLGLRGTGSHDTVADEVFVPAERVFSVFDGPVLDRPLYRFPVFGFFALSIARPRWAMRAPRSTTSSSWPAARKDWARPAHWPNVRLPRRRWRRPSRRWVRLARCTTRRSTPPGRPARVPTRCRWRMRNRLRLAATHAVRTSADVVRAMYDLAGGTAIYDGSPLQRRFRDAFTATAHFQVNEASRDLPGRVLLDQPADVSML